MVISSYTCKRLFSLLIRFAECSFENAFGERLGNLGFNPYSMLAVDVLHEWEVGFWKELFSHLVRILYSYKPEHVAVLNQRCAIKYTFRALSDCFLEYVLFLRLERIYANFMEMPQIRNR